MISIHSICFTFSFWTKSDIKNGGEESRAPAEPEESEIERIRREKNEKKQRFKEWIRSTDSTVKVGDRLSTP